MHKFSGTWIPTLLGLAVFWVLSAYRINSCSISTLENSHTKDHFYSKHCAQSYLMSIWKQQGGTLQAAQIQMQIKWRVGMSAEGYRQLFLVST